MADCDMIVQIFTSTNYTQDARFRQCRGTRNTPFFDPKIKFMHKPRLKKIRENYFIEIILINL